MRHQSEISPSEECPGSIWIYLSTTSSTSSKQVESTWLLSLGPRGKNYTNTNTPVHGMASKDVKVVLSIPEMNSSETNCQSPILYIDSTVDEDDEVVGIITLEDVMEELIQKKYLMRRTGTSNFIRVLGNSRSQSPGTATFASELASPISPYRSTPLSPNIMISLRCSSHQ